jgi:hypothetical protein
MWGKVSLSGTFLGEESLRRGIKMDSRENEENDVKLVERIKESVPGV